MKNEDVLSQKSTNFYQNEDVISACPKALNIDQLFLGAFSETPKIFQRRKKKIQGRLMISIEKECAVLQWDDSITRVKASTRL